MMRFTIGYIAHNKEVFDKYLGPSIERLEGDFDVVFTTDEKFPAANYNEILNKSENDWVILTHQDISFSKHLLNDIEFTINRLTELDVKFRALGIVGRDFGVNEYSVHWSEPSKLYKLETADCCFIVINKADGLKFDDKIFNEYHLYVEDICMTAEEVYTIGNTNAAESKLVKGELPEHYILHHSHTVNERGCEWGRYREFKQKLHTKWNRQVKTT